MRHWINLIENASQVPELSQFVTPQLIDEIIREGKWVHHGDDLDDWLDTSTYASDNHGDLGLSPEEAEALEAMPYAEQMKTPAFRKCVEHWVMFRVKDVQKTFETGCTYGSIAPFSGETILTRVVRAASPTSPLGVYWTELSPKRIVRVVPDHEEHPCVILQVKAKNVTIDWYETLRSRLDYSNGCDEAEIQLARGTAVTNVRIGTMKYRDNGRDPFDEAKIQWGDTIEGTV
jgi:hypothetical protein